MKKIQELQLKALDILGEQAARIETALDHLSLKRNEFDIEAQTYFIRALARQLEQKADELHIEMHKGNSAPGEWHDDACLHGIDLSAIPCVACKTTHPIGARCAVVMP